MQIDGIQTSVVASALGDDLRQIPLACRQIGYDGVLLDCLVGPVNLLDLSGSAQREIRHLFAREERQIAGLQMELSGRGFEIHTDADRQLDQIERVLKAARDLMVPTVCLDLGRLPEPPRERKISPPVVKAHSLIIIPETVENIPENAVDEADPSAAIWVKNIAVELARRSDRYGVVLAMRVGLSSIRSVEAFIAQADCPWFGIDLDTVAALRDRREVSSVLSSGGQRMRHIRLRDAFRGTDGRTRPAMPGEGEVDMSGLFGLLHEGGWKGWISIDPTDLPDRSTAVSRGMEILSRYGAR
jgi:sugar phosphate isomerase/epimerase